MGDPPRMAATYGDTNLPKVGVVLATYSRHHLLEARQLVLEILHLVVEYI